MRLGECICIKILLSNIDIIFLDWWFVGWLHGSCIFTKNDFKIEYVHAYLLKLILKLSTSK